MNEWPTRQGLGREIKCSRFCSCQSTQKPQRSTGIGWHTVNDSIKSTYFIEFQQGPTSDLICFGSRGVDICRNLLMCVVASGVITSTDRPRSRVPGSAHRTSAFLRSNRIPKWTDSRGRVRKQPWESNREDSWLIINKKATCPVNPGNQHRQPSTRDSE